MITEDLVRLKTGNAIYGEKTGSPYQVDTIADLKALNVSAVPDDLAVIVLGYYEAGDGGGGLFFYDAAGVGADNKGTVIAPTTGSGRWLRSYSGAIISIGWFGAVGDGVTDDAAAINAALVYANSIGGGKVMLRGGVTYLVKSVINVIYEGVELAGPSGAWIGPHATPPPAIGATILKYGGVPTIPTVVYAGNAAASAAVFKVCGTNLRNLMVDGSGLAVTGVTIMSAERSIFDSVLAYNCTGQGFLLSCLSNTQIGPTPDMQQCLFNRLVADMLVNAASLNAHGFVVTSYNPLASQGNVSLNQFNLCEAKVQAGSGMIVVDGDTNQFNGLQITRTTSFTAPGLWLMGYFNSDGNVFVNITSGGANGIVVSGTASVIPAGFPGAGGNYPRNLQWDTFFSIDKGNLTPYPVLDAGCNIIIISSQGNNLPNLDSPGVIQSTNGVIKVGVSQDGTGAYVGTRSAHNVQLVVNSVIVGTLAADGLEACDVGQGTPGKGRFSRLNSPTSTVAGLPAAATAGIGALAYVTDANANTRLSIAAGGGANAVMVFSNGVNWLIL